MVINKIVHPLVGDAYSLVRDPVAFYNQCRSAESDVVRTKLGPYTVYYITSPELIQEVLIDTGKRFVKGEFVQEMLEEVWGDGILLREGERWKNQRERLQPLFEREQILTYGKDIKNITQSEIEGWDRGEQYRIDQELQELAVRILCDLLVDVDTSGREAEIVNSAGDLAAKFTLSNVSTVLPTWVPTRTNRNYKRAVNVLESQVTEIYDEYTWRQHDATNLATILLEAAAGETTDVTEKTVKDELMTFLLEGYGTIGLTASYTLYLLAINPTKKNRVQQEAREAFDKNPSTVLSPGELPYTKKCINEALRLYPPVHTIYRQPMQTTDLGGKQIESDSILALSQFIIHRDHRFYDKPDNFIPERWSERFQQELHDFAFFPFGGGPRQCIGMRLAQLSTGIIVTTILHQYDVQPVSDHSITPVFSLTLQPKRGITLKIA